MAPDDASASQAPSARRADEVALQHLEQAAAREARDIGDERQRQSHDGQHQIVEGLAVLPPGDRQPVQAAGPKMSTRRGPADESLGKDDAEHGEAHDSMIDRAFRAPQCRPRPERHSERKGDEQRLQIRASH